ncbi:MAG TPA: type II secretion system protein M [Methylibium sp.]|uniref:type II secretion system protein M n=1 Tax=Methylibium sp. TaxID=2067992 RepID=UPI002DC016E1|nr:type II secretion system protein M [Methylibium sp.]HEU4459201.1 type II secretion system protein M [Methylibium sp.]
MKAERPLLPPALASARDQARARWRGLAPRERLLVGGAATLIALALVWMVAIQPAWRSLDQTPAQLDAVELQLQHMQRLANESRELRGLPKVQPSQAEAALRGATERLGANAKLTITGDRATLSLSGISGEALVAWLGEVRSAARARPEEAKLSRGAGGYSGTVVLSLPRAG